MLPQSGSHAQSASVLSDPSTDAGDCDDLIILADVQEVEHQTPEAEEEGYESDLEEAIQGPKKAIKNWSELQQQIKAHLAKHSKKLPLPKINQYLIISNFATLCLKKLS